jgi:hypothetical protein
MRTLAVAFILIGAISLSVSSSLAKEIAVRATAEELKIACDEAGGSFSQDPGGMYECGTDCHSGPGTDCTVRCIKDQTCTGQVPGSGSPTNLLNVLRPTRAAR